MSSNTTNNYKGPYAIEPPSFKVEPVYLSSEHAKQVERFQGYPYDAEQDARMKAYSIFKAWHHSLQVLADLKSDYPQPEEIGALEDCVLEEEGEDVFSLHWDASEPYGSGVESILRCHGSNYYYKGASGTFGPFPSLHDALEWSELLAISSVTVSVTSSEMNSEELASLLRSQDDVEPGFSIEINHEKWNLGLDRNLHKFT